MEPRNFKLEHSAFNALRTQMIKEGNSFARHELLDRMSIAGITLNNELIITMLHEVHLLNKEGNGRNTKYSWHILIDEKDHSEINPSEMTYRKIFEKTRKRININKHNWRNRQNDTEDNKIAAAIDLLKSNGIRCIQEFIDVAGNKHEIIL